MPLITWEELDKLTTADEIAELLRKHHLKGVLYHHRKCVLARATGWIISCELAELPFSPTQPRQVRALTAAQIAFRRNFDRRKYPYLLDKED